MSDVIEVVGETTPPEGCEPAQVRLVKNKREPIEVVLGCVDFKLAPNEAIELGTLLIRAGKQLGAKGSVE